MSGSSALASSDGLIRHDAYYQHGTPPNSDIMDEDQTWRITDFGNVRQFSRDGSIHATDEVFNAASHLAALILSILGSAILIVGASAQGEPWKIVSFSIYGASLMFLFGSSTLHHAIEGPWEEFLRMLDYFAIYPLIAGTFTPLCLVFYHQDPVGWTFCGTIWGLALVGMILTASCIARVPKWFSMTLYITLGWLGACFTYWLLPVLGGPGFFLFLFGGVVYTVGGYVYTMEQPNPYPGRLGFHEIWHVCVVAAAAVHWMLMYFYVLPWEG
uniref:Hemolysin III n=1 Tax=Amphora coffeiformis TaxID=265554 RepID=A0A7S3P712_9STRA